MLKVILPYDPKDVVSMLVTTPRTRYASGVVALEAKERAMFSASVTLISFSFGAGQPGNAGNVSLKCALLD